MEKEFLLIDKELVQATLAYLAKRPYDEVAAAIEALQKLRSASVVQELKPAPSLETK